MFYFCLSIVQPAGGQSNIMFSEEPAGKTSKKLHTQKFAELTGYGIFKGEVPPGSADQKYMSTAKLRVAVTSLLMERQSQGTILVVSAGPLVVRAAFPWFKL
jgi:hypothetical protein